MEEHWQISSCFQKKQESALILGDEFLDSQGLLINSQEKKQTFLKQL